MIAQGRLMSPSVRRHNLAGLIASLVVRTVNVHHSVHLAMRTTSAAVLIILASSFGISSAHATSGFPVGSPNANEPSGMAPPGANSLAGYHRTYVNDFNSSRLPGGWNLFTGHPGGLPSANFSGHHVDVSGGLLQLNTYRDPAYGNEWTTGGLCQCGHPVEYGAFFVRSRITQGGANSDELLWPSNNSWPPEIDFNENLNHLDLTTSTIHWGTTNHKQMQSLKINMLEWHTWGVIWTPTYVLYVVDGHPWHKFSIAADIPHVPMTLDFEQRAACPSSFQCPTLPSSMLIDWVAEYQPT